MKRSLLTILAVLSASVPALAQGTQADYDRALGLRKKLEALVGNAAEAPRWIGRTHKFYYRRTVKGGHDFILVDADTKAKGPAFDHARIAASLSTAIGKTYGALDLPFNAFDFVDGDRAIQFVAESDTWRCDVAASTCRKATPLEAAAGRRTRWTRRRRGAGGRGGAPGDNTPPVRVSPTAPGSVDLELQTSPSGTPRRRRSVALSTDGSEGNAYDFQSIAWSPDSKRIAVNRVRPGYRREVHYVESSRRPIAAEAHRQRLRQAR